MSLIRPSTLLLAALMASPALYQAFVTQTLAVEDALIRFLIAVPVAMVMLAGLRLITSSHAAEQEKKQYAAQDDETEILPPDRTPAP
jgi:hypothetical protein